jgi:murein DD-endopeptidase MepM/ murein hydrolase activator NlpD
MSAVRESGAERRKAAFSLPFTFLLAHTALPLVFLAFSSSLFAAGAPFPRIPELVSSDPVFSQYCDDVSEARIALAAAKPGAKLPLHIYTYTAKKDDTLIGVAARCSVPYDAIASLNRISSMGDPIEGKELLLPTLPGLYLPDAAANTFETLLLSSFDPDDPSIVSFKLKGTAIHCIPDAIFDGTVRAFFLTPSFRFPLPEKVVTSSFGMRKNPVTGHLVFHKGIDLAAPRGTPVHACADGTVIYTGFDPIYGNHVIIRHDGARESLYGHLSSIKIELHQKVKSGTILGTVGSTGQSTGPHLHFEIHENGIAKNPADLIKGNQ